jgi:transmembrane sensor
METYARDEGSERYQEACDWFVRLREAAEDADVVAQWLAWCSSEPLNREAFERVRADWVALGMLAPGAFENPPHAARQASLGTTPDRGRKRITRQPLLRKAAGIAALATCLGAAWLIWNDSQMSAAEVSILSTSPTERRSVHLDDGSLVELSGDSRLEVRMYPRRRDILLLRGEAYFSVAHDPGRPFIVRASSLNVRAVGTRFDVRTADSRVVVAVEEGVVEVGPPGDTRSTVGAIISRLHMLDGGSGSMPRLQLTSIRSGQEVAAVPDQELQILPIEPTAVASWRQGRLRFAREPLKSVIASIRAVSGKQIELADPELAELRFTGTVFSSGVDAWVMALPAVFPVSVHPDGAKFIITHRVESQN